MPTLAFEFKADDIGDAGTFEGFASIFGNTDLGNDIVERGAFTDTIARAKAEGVMPSLFYEHNSQKAIGDLTEMEETSKGLRVKGRLWVDGAHPDPDALKAYRVLKGTGKKGMSFGYQTLAKDYDKQGRRLLKKLDVFEVTITSMPMNPKAGITKIKSFIADDGALLDIREMEKALRDGGLSHKQAKALLAGGFKALQRDVADDDDSNLAQQLESLRDTFRNA